jgi:hypothetical protein
MVNSVLASFRTKPALPNEFGLEAPVLVVGIRGGPPTSWSRVRDAVKKMGSAFALTPESRSARAIAKAVHKRSMSRTSFRAKK